MEESHLRGRGKRAAPRGQSSRDRRGGAGSTEGARGGDPGDAGKSGHGRPGGAPGRGRLWGQTGQGSSPAVPPPQPVASLLLPQDGEITFTPGCVRVHGQNRSLRTALPLHGPPHARTEGAGGQGVGRGCSADGPRPLPGQTFYARCQVRPPGQHAVGTRCMSAE